LFGRSLYENFAIVFHPQKYQQDSPWNYLVICFAAEMILDGMEEYGNDTCGGEGKRHFNPGDEMALSAHKEEILEAARGVALCFPDGITSQTAEDVSRHIERLGKLIEKAAGHSHTAKKHDNIVH